MASRSGGAKKERQGSLVVVGTGISAPGQTTLEAVACIRQADRVFYAVTEPTTEFWIHGLNSTAASLVDLYAEGKDRYKTYKEMADRILTAVRSGSRVCAVFYGHPGVMVNPSHDAIRRARREGFKARMLPGISTEACLYADHRVALYCAATFPADQPITKWIPLERLPRMDCPAMSTTLYVPSMRPRRDDPMVLAWFDEQ